ncbi:MAG: long-chain fatty acid--CoA ligase [Ruminococcaceae bacterium]|nr:long-chain fatty acid--CoA ligase [Oscillospiraceae bacterium]
MTTIMSDLKAPWLQSYGDVKFNLEYSTLSMSGKVFESCERYKDNIALSFMGKNILYKELALRISETAKGYAALGIKEGDRVLICMPNVPQTVYSLYALNYIGAVACMVHPLSAVGEIANYVKDTESNYVLTLDQFYNKLCEVRKTIPYEKLIIASVKDELLPVKRFLFSVTSGRNLPKPHDSDDVITWNTMIEMGRSYTEDPFVKKEADEAAVILFSGGTTGVTKGILLSNLNFNALAAQTVAMCNRTVTGKSMLAAMPMFHGFGLGVCVHTMLADGGKSILVPKFNVKEYAKLLKKERPNYIAGVPTLFEAITRNPYLDGVKLDCLMGVFSGGDSLSVELKKKFDKFLADHGANVRIREGYGTTECVTASCLTPYNKEKEGSIGLPYPDTFYKICKVGTCEEVPYGEEGEICLTGPSIMIGYLNHEKETADTLRFHDDGRRWLHTGDMGIMDDEGFIYFKQRIKRMIITSGYNVYPSQIENIIDSHSAVRMSCVIGIKDEYKMQRIKAFVALKDGFDPSEELKDEIMALCRKNIAKYALPGELEFRETLPQTLVGKVAYTVLEKEEAEKNSCSYPSK